MDKKVVAVLFGGVGCEHEVSKMSASSIIAALDEEKYFVLPVYITKSGRWYLYDGPKDNLKSLPWEKFATPAILSPDVSHRGILRLVGDKFKLIHVDVVLPVLHGQGGEDGTIQGLCALSGIPYVGSGVLASALCMDKAMTKAIAAKIGLKQMDYLVFDKTDLMEDIDNVAKKIRYKLGYPCFIKPANTGSSVGISLAKDKKTLVAALNAAAKIDSKIVAEKRAVGRELECSVLGNHGARASVVGELVYQEDFYDYFSKYESATSRAVVPAELPPGVAEQVRQQSLAIFKAVGAQGLARVDFFLEQDTNAVIFNEINTMPGFTKISMFPMLWQNMGISMARLVDELIALALESHEN